ncbi:MAG: HAD family phosphatase [Planctomycetota bacterium]
MPETEFIFFDLGNVITFFDRDLAFNQIAEISGASADRVRAVLMDDGLQNRYETGEVSSQEFFDEFCSATGTSPEMSELLFAGSNMFSLNFRIVPLLAQLRAVGYPIGILSNTCPAHWDYVCERFTMVGRAFSTTVLSFESRSMKPDGGIYKDAIEAAGCQPEKIFFTDDLQANVDGAKDAGIDAVLFESASALCIELQKRGIRINL